MVRTAVRVSEHVVASPGRLNPVSALLAFLATKDVEKTIVEVDRPYGVPTLACGGDKLMTERSRELHHPCGA